MYFPLQQAMHQRILADSAMVALIGDRNFDQIPDPLPAFPYTTFGQSLTGPFSTKNTAGLDEEVSLHVWSRYRGKKECHQIMRRLHQLFDQQPLVVSGAFVTDIFFIGSQVFTDADGLTQHGVIRFQVLLDFEAA